MAGWCKCTQLKVSFSHPKFVVQTESLIMGLSTWALKPDSLDADSMCIILRELHTARRLCALHSWTGSHAAQHAEQGRVEVKWCNLLWIWISDPHWIPYGEPHYMLYVHVTLLHLFIRAHDGFYIFYCPYANWVKIEQCKTDIGVSTVFSGNNLRKINNSIFMKYSTSITCESGMNQVCVQPLTFDLYPAFDSWFSENHEKSCFVYLNLCILTC